MTDIHLRASSAFQWLKCSLKEFLPEMELPLSTQKYLQERTDDHSRLEKEEFLLSEIDIQKHFHELIDSITVPKILKKEALLETLIHVDNLKVHLSGHPDVLIFHEKDDAFIFDILDWKTGFFEVSAEYNEQLMIYAFICARESEKYFKVTNQKLLEKKVLFRFHIINTQSDSISYSEYSLDEMRFWYKNTVLPTFEKRIETPIFAQIGKHCNLCNKKTVCPYFRKDTYKSVLDKGTDELLFEHEKRKKEISLAKEELLLGKRESEIFDFSIKEIKRREFKEDIPNNFKIKKTMPISMAESFYSAEELSPYINEKTHNTLKIGKKK